MNNSQVQLLTRAIDAGTEFIRNFVGLSLAIAVLTTNSTALALEPAVTQGQGSRVQAQQRVGETGIVLGRAYVHRADGSSERLRRGDEIRVLDRITTESNGHAHIHFLDDALVSVRPNSVLEIVRYDYDAERPQDSAVKFSLREGVTRAISGDAASSARERFRLNTPIAAIGVRGTDFVVSADDATTRAKVYEGAIILAPFSALCSQDALGPCVANAMELDDQSLQMLALDASGPLPQVLPVNNLGNRDAMQDEMQLAIASAEGTNPVAPLSRSDESDVTRQNEVLLEGVTTSAVSSDAASVLMASNTPAISDFTPESALTTRELGSRQLLWGRYSFASLPPENERISLPFAVARVGRETTIGNSDHVLLRTPTTPARLDSNLGIIGFQLSTAQAVFNSDTGIAAMQVKGGSLEIDFNQSLFATELNLDHELTGQVDITGSGRLFDGGFFRMIDETQTISGAVSYDGAEAGYLFQKQINEGTVSGLTLWDSE